MDKEKIQEKARDVAKFALEVERYKLDFKRRWNTICRKYVFFSPYPL